MEAIPLEAILQQLRPVWYGYDMCTDKDIGRHEKSQEKLSLRDQ